MLTSKCTHLKKNYLYSITIIYCFKKSSLGQKKKQNPRSPRSAPGLWSNKEQTNGEHVCFPQCPKVPVSPQVAITWVTQRSLTPWFAQSWRDSEVCSVRNTISWKEKVLLPVFEFVVELSYLFNWWYMYLTLVFTQISFHTLAIQFPFLEAISVNHGLNILLCA